jgi:hypothetical protein
VPVERPNNLEIDCFLTVHTGKKAGALLRQRWRKAKCRHLAAREIRLISRLRFGLGTRLTVEIASGVGSHTWVVCVRQATEQPSGWVLVCEFVHPNQGEITLFM